MSLDQVSLETPLGDLIEDTRAVSPVEAASAQHRREQVGDVLASPTSRERRVLQLRFGLEDDRRLLGPRGRGADDERRLARDQMDEGARHKTGSAGRV